MKTFRNSISTMYIDNKVFAVAIDEAHCVSEWGHDFRTAYLNIGRTSRKIFNIGGHVPAIIALTGTASSAVLKDVKRELEISDYEAIITPETFDREELNYKVVTADSDMKQAQLKGVLGHTVPDFFNMPPNSFYRLNGYETNSGIIFCPHINGDFGISSVADTVKSVGIKCDIYSGTKPKNAPQDWNKYKEASAQAFKDNDISILSATKAFGMGIDKPNVRFTIHYGIPSSIESFYQEAGRAGRGKDVDKALCTIILSAENMREDDMLLNPATSLQKVCNVMSSKRYDNDDISRMLYFHTKSFQGTEFEIRNTDILLYPLFDSNGELSVKPVLLSYGNAGRNTMTRRSGSICVGGSQEDMQKALQRLLVLGIVSDYTIDYSAREFTVYTGSAEENDIREKYLLYVKGYNEGRVKSELKKLDGTYPSKLAFAANAAHTLTDFIYDTIEKGRRRGLREMRNAALAALNSENPDKTLRNRIIRYFETVYAEELNKVVESAEHGFDIIPRIIDGIENAESGEKTGGIRSANEASGLRGGVSRFLESIPDHPGLLMLRALSELMCNNYNIDSIIADINAACLYAVESYSYPQEKLIEPLIYCMHKVLERDESIFNDIANAISEYISTTELCSVLLDSTDIKESDKAIPAEIFFTEFAARISDTIKAMHE